MNNMDKLIMNMLYGKRKFKYRSRQNANRKTNAEGVAKFKAQKQVRKLQRT